MMAGRWLAIGGSLGIAILALIMLFRERYWISKQYKRELKKALLQPSFIADLRKQLQEDIQDHVKKAVAPLNKEIDQVLATVKKDTLESVDQNLTANEELLHKAFQDQIAQVQNIVSQNSDLIQKSVKDIETDILDIQRQYQDVLGDYRTKVIGRVRQLVDQQAADLLADYLQASLQGVELGNQQDFILQKLEDNKAKFLEELGDV